MKKNLIKYMLCGLLLLSGISCQDKLRDLYLDPDGFTDPSIEGFFSQAQQQLGVFRYAYGEMYHTFNTFNPMLGSGGFQNEGAPNTFSWLHDPYSQSYQWLRSIAALKKEYAGMTGSDKADYDVFLWTAGAIKEYIFHQLTDACGDVPYKQAMQGADLNFTPAFDKQADIYPLMLDSLKFISTQLKGYTLNSGLVHTAFKRNDIWFGGDLVKWRVFINSLRMRLALRLTNVLPALSKSTIQEVLADGVYVTDRASSITHVDKRPDLWQQDLLGRSYTEMRILRLWAPQSLFNVMRKTGFPEDPRLRVLFQPDRTGAYTPMPTEAADVAAIASQISSNDLAATFPSLYNRTTFEQNPGMPYMIITSSEIHLIKAEAALRWPDLGLSAPDEYRAAMQESIDIYYELNALNTNNTYPGYIPASKVAKPAQPVIDLFLTAMVTAFNAAAATEKYGLIYDQRFVHYNAIKPYELWADTRRLMKELGNRVRKSPTNIRLMERTLYPTSEELNNPANFAAVKASNNYTTPVWWTGR